MLLAIKGTICAYHGIAPPSKADITHVLQAYYSKCSNLLLLFVL